MDKICLYSVFTVFNQSLTGWMLHQIRITPKLLVSILTTTTWVVLGIPHFKKPPFWLVKPAILLVM